MAETKTYPTIMVGSGEFRAATVLVTDILAKVYKDLLRDSGSEELALSTATKMADALITHWFE